MKLGNVPNLNYLFHFAKIKRQLGFSDYKISKLIFQIQTYRQKISGD